MSDIKVPEAKAPQHLGTGRRKTAVARVRLATGTGKILINGRAFENYFPDGSPARHCCFQPLTVTGIRRQVRRPDHRHRRRPQRPGRRGAPWPRPRVADGGCQPAAPVEGRGPADARPAHARAQEIRPAGRPQTLPIQQALIALEFSRPAGFSIRRGFLLKSQ